MTVAEGPRRDGVRLLGRKGAQSRARILACAVDLAREVGLGAISFGGVAGAAGLSKSAVVRYFDGHSHLQAATVDALACQFRREVIAPADEFLGADRLRRLYGGFLDWMARGCPIAAALAGGGLPEPLRVRAAKGLAAWRGILCDAIQDAVRRGEVAGPVDAEQLSFELTGAALVYRQAIGGPGEETAKGRAWLVFERSLSATSN